jgi:hypothetical protein
LSSLIVVHGDKSVEEVGGRGVLFFSVERFIRDVCEGDACFVCGALPGTKRFNNEHVVPDWLLRRFGLYGRTITLTNGTSFRYGSYTVPCCAECNSFLGETIETPISRLLAAGYSAVVAHIDEHGPDLIFIWLALLFFKTHYKDRALRVNRDQRAPGDRLSDVYDWVHLHHIHCVARALYSNSRLGPGVVGSLLVRPAKQSPRWEPFDFADLYESRSVLLTADDVSMVAVLGDARSAASKLYQLLGSQFPGPLAPIQTRELLARLAHLCECTKELPRFSSSYDPVTNEFFIRTHLPSGPPEYIDHGPQGFGRVMYRCCADALAAFTNPDIDEIREHVKHGTYSFLVDETGQFNHTAMDPIDNPPAG